MFFVFLFSLCLLLLLLLPTFLSHHHRHHLLLPFFSELFLSQTLYGFPRKRKLRGGFLFTSHSHSLFTLCVSLSLYGFLESENLRWVPLSLSLSNNHTNYSRVERVYKDFCSLVFVNLWPLPNVT